MNTKTVLVTGTAGAIDSAAVARFVAEGCRDIAADVDEGAVGAVARCHGDRVAAVAADLTTPDGATACVGAAVERFGRLDLAFVNAGIECVAA